MFKLRLPVLAGGSILLAALLALLPVSALHAETLKAADSTELEQLLDQAREQGATVVVIEAPADTTPGAAEVNLMQRSEERALKALARLEEILGQAGSFLPRIADTISGYDPEGGLTWPVITLLYILLFLAIGYAAEWLFHRWARPHFAYLFEAEPEGRAAKISYLLLRGLALAIGLALQIGIALILVFAVEGAQEHHRKTAVVVILSVAAVRALWIFFFNLLAPDTPTHRLLNLTDDQARHFLRVLMSLLVIIAVAVGLCLWMEALRLDRDAHLLGLAAATVLATLLLVAFAIRQRQLVAAMILGPGPREEKSRPLRFVAASWHVFAVVYFVVAWGVTTTRLMLDLPNALGLVTGPVLLAFGAIAAYGFALMLIEWGFARRHARMAAAAGAEAPPAHEPGAPAARLLTFQGLVERAAGLVIAVVTIWMIGALWGVDLAEQGGIFHRLWEILLIGFLAYLAFESVKVLIDGKIAEEGGHEAAEPGEEGGATGASRLATLLPLFRNFLLIVIAVIAGMIMLSELGVDIAPLFAGAGVIGLAIGFGAQTLIRDIFSGAFFLMDDAFRRGEYIDIGSVKGTVERISIRSMQLRHHMGPLHTVPFGEIQHLTNFSRDWVMMKLPLRLTYDTDVEKVRKLIKNLGNELLEDPEIGPTFLQPLKSQGVYKMEDSAMIIRVKFMTRPGEQFMARKAVYARIRELFEKEGIHFAHREVTVRVAETPNDRPLTPGEKEAVAGAVRPLIDPPEAAQAGGAEER